MAGDAEAFKDFYLANVQRLVVFFTRRTLNPEVALDLTGEKPTITKIHLTTKAKVPGIDKAKFAELAHNAEVGCPVSPVLKAAEITLDATLL